MKVLLDIDHPSALSIAVESPALRSLLDDSYFRFAAAGWARWATRIELPYSYESLIESFPIQSMGAWLMGAGRAAELRRWGRDLLAAMTALAEQCRNHADRGAWIEWKDGSGPRRARLASGEFFESDRALREWARQEPGELRALLAEFVAQVTPPNHRYHDLAGFAAAAAMAWMETDPSTAYAWLAAFEDEVHSSPTTNGVPSAIYQLWDLSVCHAPAHYELRSRLLGAAGTDFEIAAHALAARMRGALAELDRIADPLRTSSAQLDRALAVSILAWHPRGERHLRRLQDHDPSLWVREHAAWALRVCRRDRLGREIYRLALGATDVLERQAKLQQLAPLLMPTFHVWRIEDRAVRELESRLASRELALLLEFKHQAARLDLSRISLFGRDLPKYCRGEDLSRYSGLGRQLLPWW